MTTAAGTGEVPFVRGMERAVDEDEAEKIVSKFRLDGWITERIRGIWASMHQERGPPDYAAESEFERGMRAGARYAAPGPGSSGGAKHSWIGNALLAIILGLTAWTLKATLENTTAIAVLQCQVNPQACPQVSRGQNP